MCKAKPVYKAKPVREAGPVRDADPVREAPPMREAHSKCESHSVLEAEVKSQPRMRTVGYEATKQNYAKHVRTNTGYQTNLWPNKMILETSRSHIHGKIDLAREVGSASQR